MPVYLGIRPSQALVVPRLVSHRVQLQLVCLEVHLQALVEVYLEGQHLEASLDSHQLHNVSWKYNIYTSTQRQEQPLLSYEASDVRSGSFVGSNKPVRNDYEVIIYMNNWDDHSLFVFKLRSSMYEVLHTYHFKLDYCLS